MEGMADETAAEEGTAVLEAAAEESTEEGIAPAAVASESTEEGIALAAAAGESTEEGIALAVTAAELRAGAEGTALDVAEGREDEADKLEAAASVAFEVAADATLVLVVALPTTRDPPSRITFAMRASILALN
jgi:hypothetical protein